MIAVDGCGCVVDTLVSAHAALTESWDSPGCCCFLVWVWVRGAVRDGATSPAAPLSEHRCSVPTSCWVRSQDRYRNLCPRTQQIKRARYSAFSCSAPSSSSSEWWPQKLADASRWRFTVLILYISENVSASLFLANPPPPHLTGRCFHYFTSL